LQDGRIKTYQAVECEEKIVWRRVFAVVIDAQDLAVFGHDVAHLCWTSDAGECRDQLAIASVLVGLVQVHESSGLCDFFAGDCVGHIAAVSQNLLQWSCHCV
jgi:hypothetical protein